MGIMGKLLGGALGLAIGGPIGAIVGATAGHYIKDRRSDRAVSVASLTAEQRQMVFLSGVVILAAKLCKVDGHVTRDEIATFKRVFSIPTSPKGQPDPLAALFNQAKQDAGGFEIYARQLGELFGQDREMRKNLIAALLTVAAADGVLHDAEKIFIEDVAAILGLSDHEIEQAEYIFSSTQPGHHEKEDPYSVLEVSPDATDAEIKAAHRKILKENHPDLAMARGVPEEMLKLCDQKMAAANAAYDRIKELRNLS